MTSSPCTAANVQRFFCSPGSRLFLNLRAPCPPASEARDRSRFPNRLRTLELFITHSTYFLEWLLSFDLRTLQNVKLGSAFWDGDDTASIGALLKQLGPSLKHLTMCSPSRLSEGMYQLASDAHPCPLSTYIPCLFSRPHP